MSLLIRSARKGEGALVLSLVKALAAFEERNHEVVADAATLEAALFADGASVFCDIAECDGEVAGFALGYRTFSTFPGRHGYYLEDLFVHPHMRGRGIGKGLLAHLAARCRDSGWDRLTWSVLTWNESATRFYESLGAGRVDAWFMMKMSGGALAALAEAGSPREQGAP